MEETTPQPDETPPEQTEPVRRLVRVRDGRWFGGVAGGLGRYFDVSPAIYRIVFAALAFAGGAGILLYVAAWLVIPNEDEDASIAEQALRDHRERPALAIGVGLLAFAGLIALSHAALWPNPGNLWLAALLVGAGLVWWELRATRPVTAPAPAGGGATGGAPGAAPAAPRPVRRPSLLLPVLGVLLAAAGALGVLEAVDVDTVDLRIALAAAVILVGAVIAFGAATAHRVSGLVGLGLVLLVALFFALAIDVPLRGGVGERLERPASIEETESHYRLAIGELTVDLGDVEVTRPTRVSVSLGMGELLVRVPRDVPVVVDGHVGIGDLDLLGERDDGVGVDRHVVEEGDGPSLVLSTRVGLGSIEVERE